MSLGDRLNDALGKNISQICGNRFHDAALNHCAHFASHMCDMGFTFTCKEFAGGTKPGANIRVHEVFAQCPKVGKWDDADPNKTQLIFVTLASNVDIANKRMVNIPQKHIGVYHQGQVYHYSNGQDKVVKEPPASFFAKFQQIYAGNQGLFFGWIPGEDLVLNVAPQGAAASAGRKFDLPDPVGGRWEARLVGEPGSFLVGKEINNAAKQFFGLFVPIAEYWGPVYRAADYTAELDQWAVLLEVTGACESENRFNLINTYDRAKFTFGFYQLAAHTPRDNLILLFRRLAQLTAFKEYFPDLEMRNGRLHRIDGSGAATDLEQEFPASNGEQQIMLFMNYLNPNRRIVDRQEALMAARLIHWSVNDPEMRRAQVQVAAEILQGKMSRRYQPKLGLDGKSDTICAIVADIFHQGRSTFAAVKQILAQADPVPDLLKVNDAQQAPRNRHLKQAVDAAIAAGRLGNKVYSAANNEFI
jgi:hypothetical protein